MLTEKEGAYLAGIIREEYLKFHRGSFSKDFIEILYETVKSFEIKTEPQQDISKKLENHKKSIQIIIDVIAYNWRKNEMLETAEKLLGDNDD